MPKRRDEHHIELVYGALDMLILRTLRWGPTHGHGIAKSIERMSEDALKVEHGSLYPALQRLLKEELRRLGSLLISTADKARVPGGQALTVDRERCLVQSVRAGAVLHRDSAKLDHVVLTDHTHGVLGARGNGSLEVC